MTSKADTPAPAAKPDRKARLAEELRANLARRKAQARSRRTGGADERPDGLGAASGSDDAPRGGSRRPAGDGGPPARPKP